MQGTKWLMAAIAAGFMGTAAAQGAGGGGGGAGKDTAGSAGTEPSPRIDMQEGSGPDSSDTSRPMDRMSEGAATAAQASSGEVATTLAKLHAGNEAEVNAGAWMRQHATNSKVKDFAKKMVDDHGALDKDVNAYAQKHSIALTGVASVDTEKAQQQAALDELKVMQGAQADRHYMQMMVEDHTKDVNEVKTAAQQAKHGHDQKYTKLLEHTLKKMEGHLKDAQKISHDLGARQARNPASP